jgi:putative transposase
MPRLSAPPITLSEPEQADIERLLRRSSTPQQIAMRAKIILRSGAGEGHGEISRALGITKYTSRLWRNRWLELSERELSVEERLEDAPRCGTPATFTLEQLTQLYALACDPPQKYGRPISHWTARELADELMKQKIVESISQRHVGRLLAEADLKPHQSGYWLNPPPTQNSKLRSRTSAKSTN